VRPLADAKACHTAARKLTELHVRRPFAELRSALASSGNLVVKRISRAEALALKAVIDVHGGEVVERPNSRPLPARAVAVGAATLCFAMVTFVAVGHARRAPPVTSEWRASIAALSCTWTPGHRSMVGTGTFVASDLLLTADTVQCGPSDPIRIHMSDGRSLAASNIRTDEADHVALWQVPGANARPITLGDGMLDLGSRVRVIRDAFQGFGDSVIEIPVSHAVRQRFGIGWLQLDVDTTYPRRGSPVLDSQGRLVAVLVSGVRGYSALSLALPINYVYSPATDPLFPPPPRMPPPSQAWARHLATALAEEEREEERWSLRKPALLSASYPVDSIKATWTNDPYRPQMTRSRALVASFLTREMGMRRAAFDVVVRYDGETKCSLTLRSEEPQWLPVSDERAFGKVSDFDLDFQARFGWLRDHRLLDEMSSFVARAPKATDQCGLPPSGAVVTVELSDGQPGFEPVVVKVDP